MGQKVGDGKHSLRLPGAITVPHGPEKSFTFLSFFFDHMAPKCKLPTASGAQRTGGRLQPEESLVLED